MNKICCLILFLLVGNTIASDSNQSTAPVSAEEYSAEQEYKMLGGAEKETLGPLTTGVDILAIMNSELPDYYLEPNVPITISSSGVQYLFKMKDHKSSKSPIPGTTVSIGVFEDREKAILGLGQQVAMVSGGLDPLNDVGDKAYYNAAFNGQQTSILFRRRNVVVSFGISLPPDQAIAFAKKIDNYLEHDSKFVTRGEKVTLPRLTIKHLPGNIKLKESVDVDFELTDADPNQVIISAKGMLPVTKSGKERIMKFYAPKVKEEAGLKRVKVYVANKQNVFSENYFMINVEDFNAVN